MGTTKSLTTGYTNFGIPRSGLNLKFRLKGLEKILLLVLKDKLEQKNIATQDTGCSEKVQIAFSVIILQSNTNLAGKGVLLTQMCQTYFQKT